MLVLALAGWTAAAAPQPPEVAELRARHEAAVNAVRGDASLSKDQRTARIKELRRKYKAERERLRRRIKKAGQPAAPKSQ